MNGIASIANFRLQAGAVRANRDGSPGESVGALLTALQPHP